MGGNGHDCSGAVVHQYVVGDPHRNPRAIRRVDRIGSGEDSAFRLGLRLLYRAHYRRAGEGPVGAIVLAVLFDRIRNFWTERSHGDFAYIGRARIFVPLLIGTSCIEGAASKRVICNISGHRQISVEATWFIGVF